MTGEEALLFALLIGPCDPSSLKLGSHDRPISSAMSLYVLGLKRYSEFRFETSLCGSSSTLSTSRMFSVLIEVLVVLLEFLVLWLRDSLSDSVGELPRKVAGNAGTSGTDDLLAPAPEPPGGAGKNKFIFSSNVMLFVSLGCGRLGFPALLGGGGRGGS
jgi:hypothetical protein